MNRICFIVIMKSEKLSHAIAQLSLTKMAEDVVILDLRKLTTMTDFFVICSAETDIQVRAITDAILDGLTPKKIKPWQNEGKESSNWVLLDLDDVVVHIFQTQSREYYQLEKLWGDAVITPVTDTLEISIEE